MPRVRPLVLRAPLALAAASVLSVLAAALLLALGPGAAAPRPGAGEDGRVEWLEAGERLRVETARAREGPGEEVRLSAAQAEQVGLRTARVQERPLADEIGAAGRVAFDDARLAHVFAPITGRVVRVYVAPGDPVQRGGPLATLLSPDVGAALSEAARAEADLVAARHERDRQRELVAAHAGAPRDLEGATAALARAAAEAERARARARPLSAGRFDPVTQEYTLVAPGDGDVLAVGAAPGLEVQGPWSGAGSAVELFTIGALDPLRVTADLPEMDLADVRPGTAVTVRVAAWPDRTFHGTVDLVSDAVDPATRGVRVRCAVANPGRLLRPEMAPALTLALPPRRGPAIPRAALFRMGQEEVVFVKVPAPGDGLRFRRRRVRVGEAGSDGLVPVLEGLVSGEEVAVQGGIFLVGLL